MGRPLKFRSKVLLAAVEATYGQDATPTGAANAIQCMDVTITPQDGETVTHAYVRPELGARPQIPVNTHVTLEFSVSLAGAGAAGTVPAYGVLLRGCGMIETVTAGVSVAWQPVGLGEESLTLYFILSGNRHRVLGARGSVSIDLKAADLPVFKFKYTGLYVGPDATAAPTIDLSAFVQPVPVSETNTPAFALHGQTPVLKALALDLGVSVVHRDYVNSKAVHITDRSGSGSVTIEAPAIADHDFFATAIDGTLGALSITHGITPGNIISIHCPKVQALKPRYSDDNGIAMLEMDLVPVPDAGNDEMVITAS